MLSLLIWELLGDAWVFDLHDLRNWLHFNNQWGNYLCFVLWFTMQCRNVLFFWQFRSDLHAMRCRNLRFLIQLFKLHKLPPRKSRVYGCGDGI